jgi:hypothetical protein
MGFGGMDESIVDRRANGIVTSAQRYLSGWPRGLYRAHGPGYDP